MYIFLLFFFNATATTEIYPYLLTLSLHDALPICTRRLYPCNCRPGACPRDPLASARGDALRRLHPCQPQVRHTRLRRTIERIGQWVPATSAGTTALGAATTSVCDPSALPCPPMES